METYDKMVVVGDFNVWFDVPNDKDTKKVKNLMNAYGLSQVITDPTHKSGHTLDHVYYNLKQLKLNCSVMINDTLGITSDHFPCFIDIPCPSQMSTIVKKTYRDIRNGDMDGFRSCLEDLVSTITEESELNFQSSYQKYKTKTEALVEKCFPTKTRTVKTGDPKWMDSEYRMARSKRRKLEKTWKKSRRSYKVCVTEKTLY